jgi:hypothetical protein
MLEHPPTPPETESFKVPTQKNTHQYRAKRASSSPEPHQLSFGLAITDPQEHRKALARKSRRCLSCRNDFPSDGPGNRICTGCKGQESWSSVHVFEMPANASF